MRLSAITTLLFATLTLASPAPAPAAQPTAALTPASLAPEVDARAASVLLDRASKPKKPKGGSGNNNNETEENAANGMLAPSRVLELSALGLGVMEVVRLWA